MIEANEKMDLLKRLRRLEGQIAGIRRMLEADNHCVQVLMQVAAARGAITKIAQGILRSHVETCVDKALNSPKKQERRAKVDELLEVFERYGGLGA